MDKMNKEEEVKANVAEAMAKARGNIRKGFRMLAFSLGRLFLETWVVQEIWNRVIKDAMEINTVTYWEAFFIMIMLRIVTGQFKISLSATTDKKKDNKDTNAKNNK
jgi:hypothetical protein